jgi:SAM-dependent methyltransferase
MLGIKKGDRRRKWSLDEFTQAWNEVLESENFDTSDVYRVQSTSGMTKTFHEEGYGEILPKSVHNIAIQTRLEERKPKEGDRKSFVPKRFLDIGSGIGNVVNGVAYTTLATCVGVEIHHARSKLASDLSMLMDDKRRQRDVADGIPMDEQRQMHISLYTGDGFLVEPGLDLFDVIFTNNLLFDETMLQRLFLMIGKRCNAGTLLVVTKLTYDKEIISKYFTAPDVGKDGDVKYVPGVKSIPADQLGRSDAIQKGFVGFYSEASWTSNPVPYYITKVK